MTRFTNLVAIALLALGVGFAPGARADTAPQDLVESAKTTLGDMKRDLQYGNAPDLLARAKGVMIVPQLVKGGFFFGGEGGEAVYLTRSGTGDWSYPAFYTLASASFGLQIGIETSQLVLFAMSDKAANAFMEDEFKLGAQASLAVIAIGSNVQAATTSNLNADILVWSKAKGLYGGITLEGSVIKPRASYNEIYYGHPVSVQDMLVKRDVMNAGAEPLRNELAPPR